MVKKCEDLHILFPGKFMFDQHIHHIIYSVRRLSAYFTRNCGGVSDVNTSKLLYITFVKSIFDYLVPNLSRLNSEIQFMQLNWCFTRVIEALIIIFYFHLQTLASRRDCCALTFFMLYNIIVCNYLINQWDFSLPRLELRQRNFSNTKSHSNKIKFHDV